MSDTASVSRGERDEVAVTAAGTGHLTGVYLGPAAELDQAERRITELG